ncbi:GTPase or GTP-binding protein-like protein [Candidatus Nitrososphaera gargensis Ga9.2]|uniref:polynucleotide 5'-hydroxyl-kinase n=2 Tax=Candidatus Nitrososphaera gargensis TaxID=497727 RepID=K0INS1_NITGG|nr:GTPase or GTP-binding protein-like protein [Candidatus Nitrososphaera gargensis Ga9.2]
MIKGPATVTVDGACDVLGSDVSGKTITVRAGKALPFEPRGRCRLRARLGRGGSMWLADPAKAGVSLWRGITQELTDLVGNKKTTVMLVGETDTGKSTLSVYLANVMLNRGLVPCIVDGDIGQGDLAPPTSIGAAVLPRQVTDLRDVDASLFEFVGSTSPAGFDRFVAKKLRSILDRVGPLGDTCIVNTDGYASDGGIQYKLMIASELQPDAIVCIGDNPELLGAFQGGPWQVLHATPSGQASKSRYERASRRLDQFLRYVGSGSHAVELSRIKFVYMDRLFSPSEILRPPIVQLEPENLKRMFVGLGSAGQIVGFGIITGITPHSIFVQTDVGSFDRIYLGNIRLSRDRAVEVRIA